MCSCFFLPAIFAPVELRTNREEPFVIKLCLNFSLLDFVGGNVIWCVRTKNNNK